MPEGTSPIESPRFLLVLAAHSNLLRAALVTRDLRIVSSAHQAFTITDAEFDPAEVWYKSKRVIAACLDIGRTLSREIAGVAIVASETYVVAWHAEGHEIVSRGRVLPDPGTPGGGRFPAESAENMGTLSMWLLWNLTGAYAPGGAVDFGRTRARAPFDAELPVVALVDAGAALAAAAEEGSGSDKLIVGTARRALSTTHALFETTKNL